MTIREFAIEATRIAHSKRAEELKILDVGERIKIAEYFVLCTARNRRQVQAIVDAIDQFAKQTGRLVKRGIEGYAEARWVLLDYQAVVVHVFLKEVRAYYDLELLWGDYPVVPWIPDVKPLSPEDSASD